MTRKPCRCNGDRAYANGFTVLKWSTRTSAANGVTTVRQNCSWMDTWSLCPERLVHVACRLGAQALRAPSYNDKRVFAFKNDASKTKAAAIRFCSHRTPDEQQLWKTLRPSVLSPPTLELQTLSSSGSSHLPRGWPWATLTQFTSRTM